MVWEALGKILGIIVVLGMLIVLGLSFIISLIITFLLTRKIEGRKKWIVRVILPFPLTFLLFYMIFCIFSMLK